MPAPRKTVAFATPPTSGESRLCDAQGQVNLCWFEEALSRSTQKIIEHMEVRHRCQMTLIEDLLRGKKSNVNGFHVTQANRIANDAEAELYEEMGPRLSSERKSYMAAVAAGVRDSENANVSFEHNSSMQFDSVYEPSPSRCTALVSSWQFETFFGIMIFLNALLIAVQVNLAAARSETEVRMSNDLDSLQYVFVAVFFFELVLRVAAEGRDFLFSSLWNVLDSVLVSCSLIELVLPVIFSGASSDAMTQGSNVRIFRILRITRLAKVVRMVRVLRIVRALRTLMFSILMTLRSLIWSLLLIAFILFVFGIVFTDLVTTHLNSLPEPWNEGSSEVVLSRRFGSLLTSMLTLYASALNGLAWADVADALESVGWFSRLMFESYISFVCLAVLNVLTGVFCQSAIESAQRDNEMLIDTLTQDKHFFMAGLQSLFDKLDEDHDGCVNIIEFEKHLRDKDVQNLFQALGLDTSDAWNLFSALDTDGDHAVDAEEFFEGCLRLRGGATAIDMAGLRKDLSKVKYHHGIN
eukprot:TRINITY_DN26794_c0_g3_i1.p1 TRINITY_DN26794_c0_g3~~TRINITY_DN26794_c0_g3_i1.p1  ORF type:complete len:524 (-),score=55.03 TRINITY_DN26794_c0_g3_i1:210-1781(-)